MPKLGVWSSFLVVFALLIVGILSLGCWSRPNSAPVPGAPSKQDSAATSAAIRHLSCQPRHWRTLVTQQ